MDVIPLGLLSLELLAGIRTHNESAEKGTKGHCGNREKSGDKVKGLGVHSY
jgi:hypothetical protein